MQVEAMAVVVSFAGIAAWLLIEHVLLWRSDVRIESMMRHAELIAARSREECAELGRQVEALCRRFDVPDDAGFGQRPPDDGGGSENVCGGAPSPASDREDAGGANQLTRAALRGAFG